jgi:phosphate transport system ATP-binding protein
MSNLPNHATSQPVLQARSLSVFAGRREILRQINLDVHTSQVLALLGPSGAGKSTLLRCLNRLIELHSGLSLTGDILLHHQSIFAPGTDVDELRARIGIIFQQPVIFPGSILKNVLFGARYLRQISRSERAGLAEQMLREAALWEEVRDRLHESAALLSVGQQQRLCLARALAMNPEIILLDEPTSSLDVKSTEAIEELILRLKERKAIVLVTHNLDQARRIADSVACLAACRGPGEIIESGPVTEIGSISCLIGNTCVVDHKRR